MANYVTPKTFSMSVNFTQPFSPTLHDSFVFNNPTGETAQAGHKQKKPPTGKFGAPHFHVGVPLAVPEVQAEVLPSPTVETLLKNDPRGFKGRNYGTKMGGRID